MKTPSYVGKIIHNNGRFSWEVEMDQAVFNSLFNYSSLGEATKDFCEFIEELQKLLDETARKCQLFKTNQNSYTSNEVEVGL